MFYSKKLKKFKKINHCFFSKKGGFSKGIYKSLNCGKGSKDNKKSIYRNLALVCKKMKISKTTRTSLNNSSVRQNLNATFYQQKLAEQREAQKQ